MHIGEKIAAMHAAAEAEKNLRFRRGVVKRILTKIGADSAVLKRGDREEDGFSSAWVERNLRLPVALEGMRVFTYSFTELVFDHKRSPVWAAWLEHCENYPDRQRALVLSLNDVGAIALTNWIPRGGWTRHGGAWVGGSSPIVWIVAYKHFLLELGQAVTGELYG